MENDSAWKFIFLYNSRFKNSARRKHIIEAMNAEQVEEIRKTLKKLMECRGINFPKRLEDKFFKNFSHVKRFLYEADMTLKEKKKVLTKIDGGILAKLFHLCSESLWKKKRKRV